MSRKTHLIVDELVTQGKITEEQANDAKQQSATLNTPILKVLIDERIISEAEVYKTVAEASGIPYIDIAITYPEPSAIGKLPGEWAKRLEALPFGWEGDVLQVAVSDPASLTLRDDLHKLIRGPSKLFLASPSELIRKINQTYRVDREISNITEAITPDGLSENFDMQITEIGEDSDAPVVKYVNLLITQALSDRASDIHIEPSDKDLSVRYRIDGVLHEQMSSNKSILNGVVSRIKIMANMDISEKRMPQDGRMSVKVKGRKIDLRVATLPTVYGEKVVLRILDSSGAPIGLPAIGFSEQNQELFRRQYTNPHGMILVTGPTGSGKTTTLYSTLDAVRSPEVNIITVEDPVEYRMGGVAQMQIAPKAGLTFASALRSILRADPDVVLVGEIRDRETAQIAIEAALTGHLVFSSLHTNDAPSAMIRLVEMGIEPFLVGSAVSTVVAQRLLRKLCEHCKQPYELQAEEIMQLGFPWDPSKGNPTVYRPRGCGICSKTGYFSRTAIVELFIVDAELERLVNEGAHSDILRTKAIENGMELMKIDGWNKVLQGITSVEEVLRVTGGRFLVHDD